MQQQSPYILAQINYIAVLALMQHCSNASMLTADQAAMAYVANGYAKLYASMYGAS